jgi:predicted NUDIX family phosphoesterase
MAKEEQLITIPRKLFDAVGPFQGVVPFSPAHLPLVDQRNWVVVPRSQAEEDHTYKQLVVYFTVHDRLQFLSYWRNPKGGDPRLHNQFSFGFGGHINVQDGSYLRAVVREICEEIGISLIQKVELVGLINDDSDQIGLVHLGLYYQVRLFFWDGEETGDLNIERPRLVSWETLGENLESMEGWSRLVYNYIQRQGLRLLTGNEMVRVIS